MKRMLIILSLILGLNTSVGAIDIGSDFPDPFKILPEIIIDDATPSGTKNNDLPTAGKLLGEGKIFHHSVNYSDRGEFENGIFMLIYNNKYYVCDVNYSQTACGLVESLPTTDRREKTK